MGSSSPRHDGKGDLRSEVALLVKELNSAEADNATLRAKVEELESGMDALGRKCSSLENDREYNAGLVRERDQRLAVTLERAAEYLEQSVPISEIRDLLSDIRIHGYWRRDQMGEDCVGVDVAGWCETRIANAEIEDTSPEPAPVAAYAAAPITSKQCPECFAVKYGSENSHLPSCSKAAPVATEVDGCQYDYGSGSVCGVGLDSHERFRGLASKWTKPHDYVPSPVAAEPEVKG
jgi:hypothetical protein